MMDFCILGSGIAGSTIANLLSKKYNVQILEKSKGVGGRTSNRRYKKKLSFDHGLQYIGPKNIQFKNFIKDLIKKKIIKKWEGNHLNYTFTKKKESIKYICKNGNNDLCKFLTKKIHKKLNSRVKKIEYIKGCWKINLENNEKFFSKNLIITFPYLQTKILAKKYLNNSILNSNVQMSPVITSMLIFKHNKNLPISSIKFDDKVLGWAANENSKGRFKSNLNLWTVQSNFEWGKKMINRFKKDKKKTMNIMIKKFSSLTGLNEKNIIFKDIHGWKFAYSTTHYGSGSYWNKKYKLGLCSDWFLGSKIEHSWLSAKDLFKKISKN
jgi:renalase